MAIVVTGSSGLLGGALLGQLAQLGAEAIALSGRADCDLSDARALDARLATASVTGLVHCAAFTSVDESEKRPEAAWQSNVLATRNVARLCAARAVPFVYVSTSAVFDGVRGDYVESDTPRPLNYYAWTKLLGEEASLAAGGRVVRLTVIGVRPAPRAPANFLEWLSSSLRSRTPITLYEDALLNPLSPGGAAEVLLAVLAKAKPGSLWHAGCRDAVSKAAVGKRWQERHFPAASDCVRIGRLSEVASSAARGQRLTLNVSAIASVSPPPTLEHELARASQENPPW